MEANMYDYFTVLFLVVYIAGSYHTSVVAEASLLSIFVVTFTARDMYHATSWFQT